MKTFKKEINKYIENYDIEVQLFKKGEQIRKRGYLDKKEFLSICLWKSRRPKRLYIENDENFIIEQTKKAFSEKDELVKIEFLTALKGVEIPTASAILTIVFPNDYGIIDIRCIEALKDLKQIDYSNINGKNWLKYLGILRDLRNELNLPCREIEKALFAYNRIQLDDQYKNLYK
jgi:hypothetical protein